MINLINGDCLIESDKIASGSVDLILTDLPYGTMKGANLDGWNGTKTDWDNVIDTDKIMQIANRILRKNGKMLLFAQDPFSTKLKNKTIPNIPYSYSMIWEKDHFANSLIAKKAPVSYFEDVLVFSKTYDMEYIHPLRPYFKQIYNFVGLNKKQIIEKVGQCADHTFRTNSTQYCLCTKNTYNKLIEVFNINDMQGFKTYSELKAIDDKFRSTFNLWQGNKYKSNILKYKKDYNGYHPTQKPILLLEDLIKTFSNEGDLVVDLTMGSGSTPVACINTNRNCIGIEKDIKKNKGKNKNQSYFDISVERVNNVDKKDGMLY